MVGSWRWLFQEWGGEVWETSNDCGAGLAMEKVALEELGAEGLWRRFQGEFGGVSWIWKKHKEGGRSGFECV